jgi:hypothetical protein
MPPDDRPARDIPRPDISHPHTPSAPSSPNRFVGVLLMALVGGTYACDGGVGPDDGPPAATIDVEPIAYGLIPGDTLRLAVVARDGGGIELPDKRFGWTVVNPAVANVDDTGLLTALAAGTTEIRASADGVEDAITVVVVAPNEACAAPGTIHVGTVDNAETWTAADAPHHLPDGLVLRALVTIQAGAVVCVGPGAKIETAPVTAPAETGIVAEGSAADSIVFAPRQTGAVWGGIEAFQPDQRIELSHVRIEDAAIGLSVVNGTSQVESSHFRRITNTAITFSTVDARVIDTVVEDADAGIRPTYGTVTIRRTAIRDARFGIVGSRGTVILDDVRIEGADGTAIALGDEVSPSVLHEASDVIITGGNGRPFAGNAAAAALLADPALGNDITGNANDTILISRYNEADGDVVVRAGTPWRAPDGLSLAGSGSLHLEPGAVLVVHPGTFGLSLGVPLVARGTADAPVTLIATGSAPDSRRAFLGGPTASPNVIEHATIQGMILSSDSAALHVDASRFVDGGGLELRVPDSHVRTTTFDDAADSAAIVLAASDVTVHDVVIRSALGHGIRVDSAGAAVSDCGVTGSAGDGILVRTATGVTIHDCDLEANGGGGVRNVDSATLDARFNWWGDPAGPTGPTGDGVAGPVQFVPFRLAPVATAGGAVAR